MVRIWLWLAIGFWAQLSFAQTCLNHALVFDSSYYRKMNPDLNRAFGDVVSRYESHWCSNGISEGRRASPYFAVRDYLKMYPDLSAAYGTNYSGAIRHYLDSGRFSRRAGTLLHPMVFDEAFYRQRHGLAATADSLTVAQHFLGVGLRDGLQSHPFFSVVDYGILYPGVAQASANVRERMIANYITYGLGWGRKGLRTMPTLLGGAQVLGPEQLMYRGTIDGCAYENTLPRGFFDIPDMAARAFLDADGQYQLLAGHFHMFRNRGQSLDKLPRECQTPVLRSLLSSQYANHRSFEWIEAVYTRDGRNLAAISANDWNGADWGKPECVGVTSSRCWWGSLTMLGSADAGRTYTTPQNPLEYTLARISGDGDANALNANRVGFFATSNIMKSPVDGNYYVISTMNGRPEEKGVAGKTQSGLCVFRASHGANLQLPTSWRGFDGVGFTVNTASAAPCVPLKLSIGDVRTLTYNTFFQAYLAVGMGTHGVVYALSEGADITRWKAPVLMFPALAKNVTSQAVIDQVVALGGDITRGIAYPTIIDHHYEDLASPQTDKAERRNFDLSSHSPHLYFVRWEFKGNNKERTLVRVPLRFK